MRVENSSIDLSEIERFGRLGADWWDLDGPMRPLHRLNPVRVDWIRDRARLHLAPGGVSGMQGLRILDIGCGGGILAESLARIGADVTAIDPSADSIAIAGGHAEKSRLKINYRAISAEALAAEGEKFDIVCAMEVIEHVVDPKSFIELACRLTRPGGLVFAATLNRTLKSFGLAILGAEYVLRWLPKGTHQWEKFVTPDELEDALEIAGARVIDRSGVVYAPLSDTWRLGRDMGVNYMMAGLRDG